ncbi:MAG: hypothetical protein ACYS74_18225, partial [Planctomycetota bacterium]
DAQPEKMTMNNVATTDNNFSSIMLIPKPGIRPTEAHARDFQGKSQQSCASMWSAEKARDGFWGSN